MYEIAKLPSDSALSSMLRFWTLLLTERQLQKLNNPGYPLMYSPVYP